VDKVCANWGYELNLGAQPSRSLGVSSKLVENTLRGWL
jgi:hypothetical protein